MWIRKGIYLVYNLNDIFVLKSSTLLDMLIIERKQKDIWFTSKEYNFKDNLNQLLKFLFSF